MMTTILLVRHCEADHHVNGLTGGWTDTHLTERGKRQAEAVASRIAALWSGEPFSLYTSDLHRAKETADAIANRCKVKAISTIALREMNNGKAAGLTEKEAHRIANQTTDHDLLDWRHYPGSETWREFNRRVEEFLDEIENCQNNRMVIVAHRGTLINVVIWWLAYRLDEHKKLPVSLTAAPGSMSLLSCNKWGEKTIEYMNDFSHIRGL
ncbi:histidine phosphatase family protein [Azotosporobacter soli]|uniref:histidine phosphatase family protein n=1 Tax=Azotosporobacter soli TaxID=3055040 RepID=UPI0031FE531E